MGSGTFVSVYKSCRADGNLVRTPTSHGLHLKFGIGCNQPPLQIFIESRTPESVGPTV